MFVCTSDWHLNQKEILEHERGKKFSSIESHDEYIVECVRRWLSKMHTEDAFYFLGDITDKMLSSAFGKIPKRDRRFLYEPWADIYQFTQKKEDVIYDKNRIIDLSASRVMMWLKENGKIE